MSAPDTRLPDLLGVGIPIVQHAGGYVARGPLAAAISNAGGLGMVGTGYLSLEELEGELAIVKERSDRPFGAAILYSAGGGAEEDERTLRDRVGAELDVIAASGASALLLGLHGPLELADRAREAGLKTLLMAGTTEEAVALFDHADAIVAKSWEGSGTAGSVAASVLIPSICDALSCPVLAAGGIADGRGLAAALALGAAGICIGTRFVASEEAHAHSAYKQRIVELGDEGTVVTDAHSGKPARLIRNDFTTEWEAPDRTIAPYPTQLLTVGAAAAHKARVDGDVDSGSAPAGQEAALIGSVDPAGEIVARIAAESAAVIDGLAAVTRPEQSTGDLLYDAYNRGDTAAVAAMYLSEATHTEIANGSSRVGGEEIARGLGGFLAAFPDAHWEPTARCVGADREMISYVLTGTLGSQLGPFQPEGQRLRLPGVHVLRLEDGLIAASEDYWDTSTFGKQMKND
jgi:enoyl-[acyl-carrier protein] reductase II